MSASPAAPLDLSPVFALELCEDGCPVRPPAAELDEDVTEEITDDDLQAAADDDAQTAERLGAALPAVKRDPLWRGLDSLCKALGRHERRALAFA